MTAEEKNNGASRSAMALVLVSAAIAMIPGIGFIMWIVGAPVAFVVFILAIVTLAKGRTMDGIIGLVFSFALPLWFIAAPMVSTAIFGAKVEQKASEPVTGTASTPEPVAAGKPGTTVSDAIAEAVADPVSIVGEREWTSADGRKLRAALLDVVRGTDGRFVGKFLRADGLEFDLPIGQLSPEGIEAVKTAMVAQGLWYDGE